LKDGPAKISERSLTSAKETALCQIDQQNLVLHQKIENAMKPNTQKPAASPASPAFAERIGRTLGRAWRSVLRRERSTCEWLMAQGLPAGIARALPLFLKLAVLALVLYGAFWMALLLVAATVAAWSARFSSPDHEDDYSLPTLAELRAMPGYDPNFYNDTSHEMYEDD
jgi:hypothetical protein